jgi:urea transport system substrate-binding protein
VKWAYAFEGKRRFFLVGSDYVFPRVAHEIIKDQLSELGAELVGEEFLTLGSTDVVSIIEKITASKPDVILNSINGDSNEAFFAELRKVGVTPAKVPTISFSLGEEELRHLDVVAMTGDYAAWTYFQSIDSPENTNFLSKFHKKFGPQRVVTDPMEAAYFGIKLWASAVRDAGTTETAEIRRSLRNQRMRAAEGDVRIDPATQHTFKTPRIGRVKGDGQFEIVWTAATPEKPVPYTASRTTEQWRAYLHDLYAGWGNQWEASPKR